VHIANALPTELPLVSGSAERLTQVLLNLLLNAKIAVANHPEGRITTETEVVDNDVVVRVRDNGPGIPDDVQPRIFDPFFTTRPPDQGTGLGLSIAFDIVREHSGTLELESGENGGTCFTIRLPVASGAD
jgi:signal transduction histidine kinase